MSGLDDAGDLRRLRKVIRKFASGGPVDTPYVDYGLASAPNSTFRTPVIDDPQPPAQVYADGGEVDDAVGGRFTPTPEQRLQTRQSRAAANSDRSSSIQQEASADPARYWYGFLQKPVRDALAVTEPAGTLGDLVEMSHGSSYGLPTTDGLRGFYDTVLPPYDGNPAPVARGAGGFTGFLQPATQRYEGGGSVSFPRTKATAQALYEMASEYPDQLEMDRRRWYWDRVNSGHYDKSAGARILEDIGNLARVTADNLLPGSLSDKAVALGRSLKGDRYDEALREERSKTRQAREYDLDPYLRPAAGALGTLPWMTPATGAAWTGSAAASNAAEPSHSFGEWTDRVLGGPTLRDFGDVAYDAGRGLYRDAKEYAGFKKGGSTVREVWAKVRDKFGQFQADRLTQAADEADLSRISPKGLYDTFDPKNSGLFVTMPPDEFQNYATRLPPSTLSRVPYARWPNVPGGGRVSRDDQTLDNYLSRLSTHLQEKGAYEPPSLWLFRNMEGLPEVEGHEGRHRMMALDRMGDKKSLVHLLPANKGELAKPLDERFEYLFDKYTPLGGDSLIVPQYEVIDSPTGSIKAGKNTRMEMINRDPTPLGYEPFAEGGGVLTKIARAIKGKPSTVKIAGETHDAAPIKEIEDAASKIAAEKGRSYPVSEYPEFDEARARRIAQAYEDMKHDPADPRVRRAYDALVDETMDQYKALSGIGLDFHFLRDGEADPYALTPSLGYLDLKKNGRLAVFPTSQGFGTLNEIEDNPLLRRVGRVGDLDNATANDAFRVVHDAFGHYGPGNPFFRHKGEDRAWYAHSHLYSPEALPAATSELRGQNSWVNFGPHGERNRFASGADTTYADQKTGLLPEWVWDDAPKFREGGETVAKIAKALRTRKAEKLEREAIELNRGRIPGDPYASPPVDPKLQTVDNPERITYPLIYADPRDLVRMAKNVYADDPGESGLMYQLFGHTRQSLDDLARSNKAFDLPRPETPEWAAYLKPQGFQGNENAGRVMNRRNANRIVDVLGEGLEDPELRGMRSWYEMTPLWERMSRLGITERDQRALNTRMGVMSPQSTPYDEVRRGFAANHLASQGRLDDFVRYGNWSDADRLGTSDFPADLRDLPGHAMHGTHVPNLLEFETAGRLWPAPKTNKVNTYVAASDPVLPLYHMPVADSHFTRMTGLPDVRSATTTGVIRQNMTNPEYGMLAPWWSKNVASRVDEYPRDAQALAWGLFGPATGVREIGKPKLEIISDVIGDIANRHKISPEDARDLLLSGEMGYRRGGRIDEDFGLYGTMEYASGGRVADDMLAYHVAEY